MKRVLCIVSNMDKGGAETFLMKILRTIDRNKYMLDFCVSGEKRGAYDDEIESLGGKVIRITRKSENLKLFKKELFDVVKNGKYKYVLRITSNAMGFMDLKIAKRAGAAVCCARSSNSSDGNSFVDLLFHFLGKVLYGRYIDVKIAPSDLAAIYTFGKRNYRNNKVFILKNGLDLSVFKFSVDDRVNIRREFEISENTKLIGHIGRLTAQKNHKFLLSVFSQVLKKEPDCKLMLVGVGELKDEILNTAKQLKIEDKVIFAGLRSDIPALLSAFDVFCFPSFYEGMPNTVIEAQAVGLPTVIANTITPSADVSGTVQFMSLENSASSWGDAVLSKCGMRFDTHGEMLNNGYDIKSVTEDFCNIIFKD